MALEQVFDCPRTISGLRSGPLGGFLDSFCDWLEERRFSQSTVRKHLSNVSHLGKYLAGLAPATRATISGKDIEGFFQTYPSECRNRGSLEKHLRCVRWSLNRFVWYRRRNRAHFRRFGGAHLGGELVVNCALLDFPLARHECFSRSAGDGRVVACSG
jgi:hypothetical protein